MNRRTVRLMPLLVIAIAVIVGGLARGAYAASVAFSASVQGHGWQPVATDGQMVGTTGESLPIEYLRIFVGGMPGVSVRYAVKLPSSQWFTETMADGQVIGGAAPESPNGVIIWLEGAPAGTGICYQVHLAELGWLPEVCDGVYLGYGEIQALRIRLYGQLPTEAMSIPPAEMPYDATKAAQEQALRDNPPRWDSSDAYLGNNSQDPIETVRQSLTMMDNTGTITLFHHEEEDTWGGDRWAAGYQMKAYAKTQRDTWTANSSTYGYVNAWGKILSHSFPAFTATVVANTINNPDSKWAGIWYSIYVFGNKVKEETVGGGVYTVQKKIFEAEQKVTPEYTYRFSVGPIPVAVGAYGSAKEFIALTGKFWIDELNGTIEPSGSLWVTAYGAVGVPGVIAGKLKGQLSLLEAAVPINAKITWMFGTDNGGQCEAAVAASANASAILKQLSGRLAACAEVGLWWWKVEKCLGIAGYDGFRQTIDLFNVAMSRELAFGRCADGMTSPPTQS